MSDNIFALLQQAHQVGSTGDAKIFGVEIAIVTNAKDPQKSGRVKVCFPRLPGKPESDWARVAVVAAGPGRGFYWIPQVHDEVLVAFERGEASRPYVIGALWNGKDQPMKDAYSDDNTTVMLQSKSGHKISLEDEKDKETVLIADKSGKRSVTFDVKAAKLYIEDSEGSLVLHAAKKIVFACEDLEIKTSKTAKIEIGTKFNLTVTGKAQIEAGPVLEMKANRIDLNDGSSSGSGSGAGAARNVARTVLRAAAAAAASKAGPGAAGGAAGGGRGGAAGGGRGGDLASDAGSGRGKGSGGADAKGANGKGGAGAGPAQAGGGAGVKPAGGAVDKGPQEVPAAAAAVVSANELDVQVVNVAGAPQKDLEVELRLPGGQKRAGKTDETGHFKAANLTTNGNASLLLPDIKVAPAAAASAQGRVRYLVAGVDLPIGKASVVEIPPRVRRGRMKGMHFETAKTFLLPSAMVGMRQLVKLFKSFEGLVGLVNGHTDKQGAPTFNNRGLSSERADAIKAFLLDDAVTWMKWYGFMPASKSWGVREDQLMLSTVRPSAAEPPFLSPPHDSGKLDAETRGAYLRFQKSRLLGETGSPDANTRLELVRAYMALEGTSLDKGAQLSTHGCGPAHPLPGTETDPNPDQAVNRRVEVFLFENKIDPTPRTPCPAAGCPEYDKWVAQKVLDVDLDLPPGSATIKVTDEAGAPIEGAHVHLSGPIPLDANTSKDGVAQFDDLVPGDYTAIANADTFDAADSAVVVPSGAAAAATLLLKKEGFDLEVSIVDDATPAAPVAGASVAINAKGVAPATSAADGIVRFAKLPPGTFHLIATHPEHRKSEIDAVVGAPAAPASKAALGIVGDGKAKGAPVAGKPASATMVMTTNLLVVNLKMLFALPDKPALSRWDPNRVVSGATVELIDLIGVINNIQAKPKGPGTYQLNVSSLETGPFKLQVTPPAGAESTGPAGTATASAAATEPDFRWRPFTATLTLDAKGMTKAEVKTKAAPPDSPSGTATLPPPPFATVAEVKPLEVTFDWRPDWIKRVKTPAKTFGGMSFGRAPSFPNGVDLLVIHQTGAPERIGNQINTLAMDQGNEHEPKVDPTTKTVPIDPATGKPAEFKRFATSAHYLIDVDGYVIKMVHEDNTAIHAEPGHWLDSAGNILNARSVGFEVLHADGSPDDTSKMHVFTEQQYTSILRLVTEVKAKFAGITRQRVIGHCDLALKGDRTGDPGILFEWHRLWDLGLSRKPSAVTPTRPYGIDPGGTLDKKDKAQVGLLQKDLKTIGYLMTDAAGSFGTDTTSAVQRFKRHWFSSDGTAGFKFPAPDTLVDFETAKRIIQVVSDGDVPAALPPPSIKSFKATPTAPGGKAASGAAGATVFVAEGDTVRLTWELEGAEPATVRLDPGGLDVKPNTKGGKGTIDVKIGPGEAVDGKVTFKLTLNAGAAPPAPLVKSFALVDGGVGAPAGAPPPPPPPPPPVATSSASATAVVLHAIPARSPTALTGTAFLADLAAKGLDADKTLKKVAAREAAALVELLAGNVPSFLRTFIPIDVTFKTHTGKIFVSPDFLAIGSDADFVRWPMTPVGAQKVMDAFGATFATTQIADLIFAKGTKLFMHSHTEWLPPKDPDLFGFRMRQNGQFEEMNKRIEKDTGGVNGGLQAGHKKDVILHANVLDKSKPVIIYGAIVKGGKFPLQDPFPHHSNDYEDYSHGIRLVSQQMEVDGKPAKLFDVLRDKDTFGLVTSGFDPKFPLRYP